MSSRVPNPAYPAKDSAVLYGEKELYAKLGEIAEAEGEKTLVEEFEIPIRSGKAWVVKKGGWSLLVFCFANLGQAEVGQSSGWSVARVNSRLLILVLCEL